MNDMSLKLRVGSPSDTQACGHICYEAFKSISEQHGFPPDFPVPEMTLGMMSMLFSNPHIYSLVAEQSGEIVGSNFLWEDTIIAGVGPLTVSTTHQNASVGRTLMEAILERAQQQQHAGVRLVQAAFHNRSLSLYLKLGFDVQEPLTVLKGQLLGLELPGYLVRTAMEADLKHCNRLHRQVHGYERSYELQQAIQNGTATVVEHDSRITGYATLLGFFGHAVGESNEDLKALIGKAKSIEGPGFLIPTRNSHLLRWCLQQGLRISQPMTLMSMGLYNQPAGVFLPSILF